MSDILTLLAGGYGSVVIEDANDYTLKKYAQILVLSDAALANFEEGDYTDSGAASGHYNATGVAYQNLSGVTVKAGALLRPHNKFFTRVKMTSGQVQAFVG